MCELCLSDAYFCLRDSVQATLAAGETRPWDIIGDGRSSWRRAEEMTCSTSSRSRLREDIESTDIQHLGPE